MPESHHVVTWLYDAITSVIRFLGKGFNEILHGTVQDAKKYLGGWRKNWHTRVSQYMHATEKLFFLKLSFQMASHMAKSAHFVCIYI